MQTITTSSAAATAEVQRIVTSTQDLNEIQFITLTGQDVDEIQSIRTFGTHVDDVQRVRLTATDSNEIQHIEITEKEHTQKNYHLLEGLKMPTIALLQAVNFDSPILLKLAGHTPHA